MREQSSNAIDGEYHTLAAAAKILGISIKTLRSHIDLGRIRCVIVGNGTVRKTRRVTDKNIASFTSKQKVREVPPCLSTNINPKSTNTTSKSNVVAFSALQKPPTKRKQKA